MNLELQLGSLEILENEIFLLSDNRHDCVQ